MPCTMRQIWYKADYGGRERSENLGKGREEGCRGGGRRASAGMAGSPFICGPHLTHLAEDDRRSLGGA